MAVSSTLLRRRVAAANEVIHHYLTGDGSYPSGGYSGGTGFAAGGGYNQHAGPAGGIFHLRGGVTSNGYFETYNLISGKWKLYTDVNVEASGDVSSYVSSQIFIHHSGAPSVSSGAPAMPWGTTRCSVRALVGPASYNSTTGFPITPAMFGLVQVGGVVCPAYAEAGEYLVRWDRANSALRFYTAVGTEANNATNLATTFPIAIAWGR